MPILKRLKLVNSLFVCDPINLARILRPTMLWEGFYVGTNYQRMFDYHKEDPAWHGDGEESNDKFQDYLY
jgi:hypothetical protein